MRVTIVSNQPLCREALAVLVTDALQAESVLTAQDIASLPAAETPADILLLDIPASASATTWLRAAEGSLASRRLLVVPERNLAVARLAHAHGFQGLLPKTSERSLMIAILKLVMAGGEYFPCFDDIAALPATGEKIAMKGLSIRQREVFNLMYEGRTNKEIAKALGVSIATVKLDIQAILSAAGARNRLEAASRFVDNRR
jgi:two-component system nitrate/nitrite response regulator NarL